MEKETIKKFKEECILKEARELASNYDFIKNFILDRIKEYTRYLVAFLDKYKKRIDDFLSELKLNPKISKNNWFFGQINFINNIPKLIKIHNTDEGVYYDADYPFLKQHFFKVKDKKKINELHKNLDDLQKKIDKRASENISSKKKITFNIKQLYFFGNFILNFLTEPEMREKLIVDLLKATIKSKENEFNNIIDPKFINDKKIVSNWNVADL